MTLPSLSRPYYKEEPEHWQWPHKAADCAEQTSNKVPSGRVWTALLTDRVDLVFVMGVGTGESSLKQSKLISFHLRIMAEKNRNRRT